MTPQSETDSASIPVRPYAESDWDAICRIHDAARLDELRGSVGLDAFLPLADTYENEGLFDNPVWVAELEGRVAGFVAASPDEITWIYVDPAMSRRGVARALMQEVFAHANDRIELEVLDGNDGARAFYEAIGFAYESSTTGKLTGNESFPATGHTLVWTKATGDPSAD
ncbi:MAG TPA: GNAT family N-acetyltransferase [Galbitalea sp.]|jgi:ribosomal protein S18 acetylase RimI-like enzyme